ncbi:MAG: molybdopterin-dependent oxidoreductase [Deltaproteobacteria bacterium]|nr:molybdopterin-dependent oxidoreductase [Deltaproteobacteria bacterium]MBW1962317.1 molybdopterin-dependent oxidoreductase [Deltaproteobacteria bacterium]MBW1993911.1 molybdopterin-dependent oxidoreductase [Deltaproteobacteria bacterium]MBW2151845.1 molybdopterin-dependent oxidoreductase [Deltaproteobacteria bacterium]
MPVKKPTVCQICGCNCRLLATVDHGKIVAVEGDPAAPQNRGGICIKGKYSPEILYAPDRLRTPLKRTDDKSGFEPIGWDRALKEIAGRLKQFKDTYGAQSLAIYRGRSTRFIDRIIISALARLFGTPNVTGVWTLCVGPKVLGYQATFGTPLFPRNDFKNARLIVLWDTNPPVTKMHRYFQLPQDIRSALNQGAELVVIDPRRHRFAGNATLHLPFTPGTDTYLIMALIRIIVERGWVDLYRNTALEQHTWY